MSAESFALEWPSAWAARSIAGVSTTAPPSAAEPGFLLRRHWSDFQVTELAPELERLSSPEASDEQPPHQLLLVEKQGLTTPALAAELARLAGCRPADVGRFGLKDRHAVTRQWLSVPRSERPILPGASAGEPPGPRWRVLECAGGQRKLRPGGHAGNAFVLVLRGLIIDSQIEERLASIRADGVPNYFGPQRFGHAGGNVEKALLWLAGSRQQRQRGRRKDRQRNRQLSDQSRHLSVLRALFFNEVLAARVRAGSWQSPIDGDVLDAGEATAPLWGRGRSATSGAALACERVALMPWWIACQALEFAGVNQARRALRFRPDDLRAEQIGSQTEEPAVKLSFSAPPGAFATALLAELGEAIEARPTPAQLPPRSQGQAA